MSKGLGTFNDVPILGLKKRIFILLIKKFKKNVHIREILKQNFKRLKSNG
jgi:hypothetical protein